MNDRVDREGGVALRLHAALPAGWSGGIELRGDGEAGYRLSAEGLPPVDGELLYFDADSFRQGKASRLQCRLDGMLVECSVMAGLSGAVCVLADGFYSEVRLADPSSSRFSSRRSGRASSEEGVLVAPMPATVTELLVAPGQAVTAGQPVARIEAMKMVMTLTAPGDGVVGEVAVAPRDPVLAGQRLMVFE
ncbi:acyl-CoA carboxylase biotin carboxyl carrier protein subunit [Chromobacterium violaceum]|uniref:acetyl-CoA carboxylase biotin carboxyl carrier protein subunit n=1 Tax=Chromobacterium violaceum TaxID=536 RepID=UPI00143DB369|nr:acetyl-CoA carboxylase biotin carboxyl carrier protein subunit [Chromobacterium violaceum]QIY77869.1 acetyl-CoA carboxylase biotin carboxyl carrier protein subunit [Chromobacterium violaceum]